MEKTADSTGKSRQSGPVRQCALTRQRFAAEDMIRFCLAPDGHVVPDLKNRLPGRGVWLTGRRGAVEEAVARGVFPRAFKRQAIIDPALPQQINDLLERAVLERLSLANKAGLVTTGFSKVAEAVESDGDVLLLHASDASADGLRKLTAKAGRRAPRPVDCLNSGQLSLALGRSNVVHAAMKSGGARDSFLVALDRLQKFRGLDVATAAA